MVKKEFLPRVRSPRYWIHCALMPWKSTYWKHRNPDVKYYDFSPIHHDSSHVVRVLLVPGNSDQRRLIITFIYDGWMLEIPKIKVPDWAIFTCWCEHTDVLGKADVVDCLIMGYQLSLDNFLLNVPDCASCVNAWSTNHFDVLRVPIEASKRCTVFRVFRLEFMKIKQLTLNRLLLRATDLDSLPTSHILRYSPEVAIRSLWVPYWRMNKAILTRSGIHIIFVGGYSCSKTQHLSNSPLSSLSLIISILFWVSSMNEPSESRRSLSFLLLKLMA